MQGPKPEGPMIQLGDWRATMNLASPVPAACFRLRVLPTTGRRRGGRLGRAVGRGPLIGEGDADQS